MKQRARARVRVVLVVDLPDAWGGDCPMSQIMKQAIDGANGRVERLVREAPETLRAGISVAGVEMVDAICTQEPDR